MKSELLYVQYVLSASLILQYSIVSDQIIEQKFAHVIIK
jgi:hypothetical protein